MRHVLLAIAITAAPLIASAQEVKEVKFAAGNYGTMIEGQVTGQAYIDYRLGAGAGQKMFAELTPRDGGGTVYFNILPPGSDGLAIYNASIDGNSALIDLPEAGTYTIRVYLMGNDEDSGATVPFNLDLSIQ
ncbi:hypothetical protein SAMN05444339_104106 [Loktanella atrilutea]|uniref:Inhibitor of g-type lysozyme n=1 Tax=Loktanella atrilutea TaxID=366533 RepID=A0A1M4ZSR6_LOKAT|nr:hypothetical protein [Loktanella atrilutea]SHF20975.1 hypothetical protein SAMN05444339_104106 [Loktanella atrilutea]